VVANPVNAIIGLGVFVVLFKFMLDFIFRLMKVS
jgi:hypothetical protein